MANLAIANGSEIIAAQQLSESLYKSWVDYIDAAPKTIETYTKAIRQFFKYLSDNGIERPERQDIIDYR